MRKTLGIIGGVGANASLRLAQQVVTDSQAKYGTKEELFVPFALFSLSPVAMDENGFVHDEQMRKQFLDAVVRMNCFPCDVLIVACNTAHCFIEDLRAHSTAPIISLIETACDCLDGASKVSVLCSETTNRTKIFDAELEKRSMSRLPIPPDEQNLLSAAIKSAISTNFPKRLWNAPMRTVIQNCMERGADKVILGCTELPLCVSSPLPKNTVDAGFETIKKALTLI